MSDTNRKRKLAIALVWIVLIGLLVAGVQLIWKPLDKVSLAEMTGSGNPYAHSVRVKADGFSGYAFLRSPAMEKTLKETQIKLAITDDSSDKTMYPTRMQELQDGTLDMAVFTLDAFIKAGWKLGYQSGADFPATIVLVIDETVGADAIVAFKDAVPSLSALNHTEGRFVFTPDSPSDYLARVVYGQLSFPLMPDIWYEEADGSEDVLKRLKAADPKAKRAYVLWEPYLSEALTMPGVHRVFGSDKCQNCIVDVLVVRRAFLAEQRDVVKAVVKAYFTASHSYHETNGVDALLIEDAHKAGQTFTPDVAKAIAAGIQWKRVRENEAHFGLSRVRGQKDLEALLAHVTDILMKTKAIDRNPIGGKSHQLFHDGIMRELQNDGFHPGKKNEIVANLGPGAEDLEPAREAKQLPALDDAGWKQLVPVGNARVEPIGFKRGTAELSEFSSAELDTLARSLESWSTSYVRVVGAARREGDPKANAQLAADRGKAVSDYLIAKGVSGNRIRTETLPVEQSNGAAEVQFVLLQQSY